MNQKGNPYYEPHPDEAWSWEYARIPYPIERVEQRSGDIWYYFRNEDGDLFFQTAGGIKTAAEMEAAAAKRRQKKRR